MSRFWLRVLYGPWCVWLCVACFVLSAALATVTDWGDLWIALPALVGVSIWATLAILARRVAS